jgi:hypothetical protein
LVVLERLAPGQRLAFVLHDMFAVFLRGNRLNPWSVSGRRQATGQPGTSADSGPPTMARANLTEQ